MRRCARLLASSPATNSTAMTYFCHNHLPVSEGSELSFKPASSVHSPFRVHAALAGIGPQATGPKIKKTKQPVDMRWICLCVYNINIYIVTYIHVYIYTYIHIYISIINTFTQLLQARNRPCPNSPSSRPSG
jgi:hypothetical protein